MARGVANEVKGPSPVLFHGFSDGGIKKISNSVSCDISHLLWFNTGASPLSGLLQSINGKAIKNQSASNSDDAAIRGLLHMRQHFAGVLLDSAPNPATIKAAMFLIPFIPSNISALERLAHIGRFAMEILDFQWGRLRTLFPVKYYFWLNFWFNFWYTCFSSIMLRFSKKNYFCWENSSSSFIKDLSN